MLYRYTGWGYFEYQPDSGTDSGIWLKQEQEIDEPCYFELPNFAQKEIEIQGTTSTDYLLLSDHSYLDERELNIPRLENGELRFNLSEYLHNGHCYECVDKTITITSDDITEAPKPDYMPISQTETGLNPHSYLDEEHQMFSKELNIAIRAWNAVLKCNPSKPKSGSRKKLITDWLEKNHPTLPNEAKNRIATLLNPDKTGGAPKSY
ncbi:MAG: hypothetical protein CTY13_02630 [Methylobacter sp.]|nr:MAG: hypothetical protein CTY13_02630 [Methylobacter sp.]